MKHQIQQQSEPPKGFIVDSTGVAITATGLPLSDYYFQATSFILRRSGGNLHIVFGNQTAFADESEEEFRLAIELIYPLDMAARYLVHANWLGHASGTDLSFGEFMKKVTASSREGYSSPKQYKIPKGNSYRSFPANFSLMSMSTGQGCIEFFQAHPAAVVEAIHRKGGWRPNSDVKTILSVFLSPVELNKFLAETKDLLSDFKVTEQEIKDLKNV